MEYTIPDISKFESSRQEREVAARFTRFVRAEDNPNENGPRVWLEVDGQGFELAAFPEDNHHAEWFCWMLAKALIKVQYKRRKDGGL